MKATELVTEAVSGKNSELANKLTDQLQRLGGLHNEFAAMHKAAKKDSSDGGLPYLIECEISQAEEEIRSAINRVSTVLSSLIENYTNEIFTI